MAKTSFYSGSGTNSTDVAAIDSLKTAAENAKTAAETAQAAAETAEANAETSATNAASSATSVSTSASTATTKASEAAASASTATTKASEAATSASTATTRASEAATSASGASTSASTATTKASEASTSATNAATSETNAASSATSASTSASTATTKASEASTSASTATTKASEASTSASSASTSSSTATTKASEAATSASTATTKASEASASATAAASSATSASSAQTAAESARDSALASFDSFDDRYLGAKSSEPSVDNDGNALVGGSLFFDTTASSMKVYTGSAWVSAYTSLSGALLVANNLSDVNSAAASATNLGLGTGNTPTFAGATVNGNIAVTGTVDGRDIAADGTKLDGIEASADVTDTANVTAAGALMDSELADVSAVKGINQALTTTSAPTFNGMTLDSDSTLLDFSRVGDAVAGKLKYVDADTGFHFGTTTNHDWYAISNDTKRLKIDNGGDISFYDTSGNAKFFWDASAERLSLGTAAPVSKIDIVHTGNTRMLFSEEATDTSTISTVNTANSAYSDLNVYANNLKLSTNGSERLRLTSSGSLGVGTSNPAATLDVSNSTVSTIRSTSGSYNLTGFQYASGFAYLLTNGQLEIGTSGANILALKTNNTERMRITTDKVQFSVDAKVDADNTRDLGASGARWKDLYLSGGVYLGGTGASNKLSDFEEGTYTVYLTDSSGNTSSTSYTAYYTKIGNMVMVEQYMSNISSAGMASGESIYFSLPFVASASRYYVGGCITDGFTLSAGRTQIQTRSNSATSVGMFRECGSGVSDAAVTWAEITASSSDVFMTLIYRTTD